MKSLTQLCKPRPSIFDRNSRDVVLDLTNFLAGEVDAEAFFRENFVTQNMKILLEQAFRRFKGQSDQGVFLLSQAMGGGKTHNMISLGLLAQFPGIRATALSSLDAYSDLGPVRVIGFTGRESDARYGIWGALAEQLGKKELFNDYYSPLQAPGQSAWVNLLKGEPLLILLDELPPYFENARSKTIGNSDLAAVTATALANLLVAVGKQELSNVCVVISDLRATYAGGSQALQQALHNFENEVGRGALPLEPVRLNTDELYHILRTRLFESCELESDSVGEIAQAYANAVREAKQMDITNASAEQFATQLRDSYPFHFSIKDLYARFRENPGFQQTRGLIRFMRTVVARLWESKKAETLSLVHAHDVDLNDNETLRELQAINPSLDSAISHDIANKGGSVAELLDLNRGGQDAQDASKLLLMASLANVPNATLGLSLPEVVSLLCQPGRDVSQLPKDVLGYLSTRAWYLHSSREGRLFFKNVENLVAKLKTRADSYNRETSLRELRKFLQHIFEPTRNDCYQLVAAMPAIDEVDLDQEKVTLLICEPSGSVNLAQEWLDFHADQTFKNRMLFLTGERATLGVLIETAAELRAIASILDEMKVERLPDNDPQFSGAREMHDKIRLRLLSAARESFTRLLYPAADQLLPADFQMNYQDNNFQGEKLIRDALLAKQKFTEDIASETFRAKCEQRLFTQQQMAFSEIKRRAAINTKWQWHHPSALDDLKNRMLMEDQWRDQGGLLDKGPFPLPVTDVKIQELRRDEESGEVSLKLTPLYGDVIHFEIESPATPASSPVETPAQFSTTEMRLTFLAVDSTGKHETGQPRVWQNRVTLRYRLFHANGQRQCEIVSAPPAEIRYMTDGSDPRTIGGVYLEPFPILPGVVVIQAVGEKSGILSEVLRIDVPQGGDDTEFVIDRERPLDWNRSHRLPGTKEVFDFFALLKKYEATASGMRLLVSTDTWLESSGAPGLIMTADQFEMLLAPMREVVDDANVTLEVEAIHFTTGDSFLHWVEDQKVTPRPEEIHQP